MISAEKHFNYEIGKLIFVLEMLMKAYITPPDKDPRHNEVLTDHQCNILWAVGKYSYKH